MWVGRHGECARLRGVLRAALDGRSQVVALRGDPGIGKTALLDDVSATAVAEGFRVVRMQGHEAERDIPFAALSMLVGPLLREVATDLPEVQTAALQGALNLGPAVHGDRMAVSAATLAVLAAATERAPVLVAVDDLHLIDVPTVETLFFALRRVHSERLAAVLTARSEMDVPASMAQWLDTVPEIRLSGLDLAEARELVAERGVLDAAAWTATGGNPLALLELTAPNSTAFLDEPIQLSARLMRAYSRRLTGLDERTREALLLLAVLGRGEVFDAALAHRGLRRVDLEPAEDAGLVVVEQGVARFHHPLVCSAVYHSVSPAMRRSAHQTMVAAYEGRLAPGAAERRAFHLAAATAGPDDAVAERIAAAAGEAAKRHSHTTATALYERAARLSPLGDARTKRTIDAAFAAQAAGMLGPVGPLLDQAIAETDDVVMRTVAMHLQCRIQMWSGRPVQARDQLSDLADTTRAWERQWSALMRSQAAVVSTTLGEQGIAAAMATQAMADAEGMPDEAAMPVLLAQAFTQALIGEAETARALMHRCAPRLDDIDPLSIDQLHLLAGLAYLSLGEVSTARRWLEIAVAKTRAVQAAGLLPFQMSALTLACWLDGDWTAALAHGHAAVQLAEDTGWATHLPECLIELATVEVTLGHEDGPREHLARAARTGAEPTEVRVVAARTARVVGLLELAAGRPAEAATALSTAAEFALAGKLGDPVLLNWAADLTEALVRTGEPEQAAVAHRSVRWEAERTGRLIERAVDARCAGLLAPDLATAREAFEEALRLHEQAAQPFEEARTRLCYGELLRRHRLRGEARTHLGAAATAFDRLGAAPWSRRAEAELQATGLTARQRTPSATDRLTPQELQVAIVVAQGVSNAEAAARLFVSQKTIEFHLSNIYRKLGVRTRAELTRRVHEGRLDEGLEPPAAR